MKNKFTLAFLVLLLAGEAVAQFTYTYTGKPRFQILTRRATTDTLGIINIELFPNIAPRHTRNFDSLVSTGFYDSTAFHRVVPGFVIQGGDPNSRSGLPSTWGFGDPSQPMVNAEFTPAKHLRGIISAARQANNINSATSQFFICVAAAPNLNNQYSVYGRVTSGLSVVDTIVSTPRDLSNNRPLQKIDMFVTYIGSNDTVPYPPALTLPLNNTYGVDTSLALQLKWSAVSDGILYEMHLSKDSLFNDTVSLVTTPNLLYIVTGLQGYTTYYWRVRTNNGGHFSDPSPAYKFHTTDMMVATGIPLREGAGQQALVFPNPGTGKFTFSGLEKGNQLEVLDINGKLIYETVLKDTSVTIDLEGKEKGIYLYRVLNAQKEVQQGRLILK